MRFPVLHALLNLPWRGAIDNRTYQRLALRAYVISLSGALIAGVFIAVSKFGASEDELFSYISLIPIVLISVVALFAVFLTLKLSLLRLRDFGLGTWKIVGILVLLGVGGTITETKHHNPDVLLLLLNFLFTAASAALMYAQYFVKSPQMPQQVNRHNLLEKWPESKAEKALLWLQEALIWFFILFPFAMFVINVIK